MIIMDIFDEKSRNLEQLNRQLSLLRRLQPFSSSGAIPSKKINFVVFVKDKFGEEYDENIIESTWLRVFDHFIKSKTVSSSLFNLAKTSGPILISDDEKDCEDGNSIVISSEEEPEGSSDGQVLTQNGSTSKAIGRKSDVKSSIKTRKSKPREVKKEKKTRSLKNETNKLNKNPLQEPKKRKNFRKKRLSSIEAELLRKELLVDTIIATYSVKS